MTNDHQAIALIETINEIVPGPPSTPSTHPRDPYGWWCLAAMALVLIAILCGIALAMMIFK